MKVTFLICVLFLFSLSGIAQDFNSDSTITITQKRIISTSETPVRNLEIKGQIDAENHYKQYKGPATVTLITSLVSPLVGLIPAIISSAKQPKIKDLGYPNEQLFEQPAYNASYSKNAKKIKQRKVWTNWGIGFSVNIVLVLLLSAG